MDQMDTKELKVFQDNLESKVRKEKLDTQEILDQKDQRDQLDTEESKEMKETKDLKDHQERRDQKVYKDHKDHHHTKHTQHQHIAPQVMMTTQNQFPPMLMITYLQLMTIFHHHQPT